MQAALASVGQAVGLPDLGDAVALDGDLGVDSYHLTEVARHLEEAHALRFTLVDWVLEAGESEAGYTIGSLLDYLEAQLAALPRLATDLSPDPTPELEATP